MPSYLWGRFYLLGGGCFFEEAADVPVAIHIAPREEEHGGDE